MVENPRRLVMPAANPGVAQAIFELVERSRLHTTQMKITHPDQMRVAAELRSLEIHLEAAFGKNAVEWPAEAMATWVASRTLQSRAGVSPNGGAAGAGGRRILSR